mmetsp:Transcript_15920/g.27093  ORF Transcript_15920/g.27093 Transcript_15920/m.27093 type:complete len:230 (+) Transcript_15920:74-763(+)
MEPIKLCFRKRTQRELNRAVKKELHVSLFFSVGFIGISIRRHTPASLYCIISRSRPRASARSRGRSFCFFVIIRESMVRNPPSNARHHPFAQVGSLDDAREAVDRCTVLRLRWRRRRRQRRRQRRRSLLPAQGKIVRVEVPVPKAFRCPHAPVTTQPVTGLATAAAAASLAATASLFLALLSLRDRHSDEIHPLKPHGGGAFTVAQESSHRLAIHPVAKRVVKLHPIPK